MLKIIRNLFMVYSINYLSSSEITHNISNSYIPLIKSIQSIPLKRMIKNKKTTKLTHCSYSSYLDNISNWIIV